jgi:hypothetical protein
LSRLFLAALVVGVFPLAACGEQQPEPSSAASSTSSNTTPRPGGQAEVPTNSPTDSKSPPSEIGRTKTSGGIELRVVGVRSAKTLRYVGGTQTDVTPDAVAVSKRAPQGGSYVFVRTRVKNDTKRGIDITCGYAIEAKAIDSDDREFDPVDDLFLIAGNPGCNDNLQPGFRATMTWAFLVPSGVVINGFKFADVTDAADGGTGADPEYVLLPPTT